ncbi:MAG TPA: mycofactocin biosynthesis glycosyltransferase MftF [Solirubrobacterales bacterium]|jgi:mycofactocin system glycosyltransferase|nr:mycofactocin biosynthesis glycosyltransferase MftF [Solirubrobacterales bacterium]
MSRAPAYRLGAHTRRGADGLLLAGGWPPRCLRLSEAGAAALDAALDGGTAVTDAPPLPADGLAEAPGAAALVRRLVAYGMLDPVAGPGEAELTFVVPVRDGGAALGALVADLVPDGAVIVVDDGSRDDSAEVARHAGATVIPNEGAPGPAGARNTGWRRASTEFVAFIDADCLVDGDWARPLAGLLADDPELALAAARVRGKTGSGRLARWERTRSPLDMGSAAGLVGPDRRVSFVPSAALVARRSALVELDGFAEELRVGEDVDLVWRAVAAGWSVRYAPEMVVRHPPRPTLAARARQHFDYGTSAAALEHRHPGAAVPLRANRIMLPAALLGLGSPGGALFAGSTFAALAASRSSAGRSGGVRDAVAGKAPHLGLAVARLGLDAELIGGRELARALARDWLPVTLLLATRRGRARRLALLALTVDAATATASDPTGAPFNALLRLADNAAYCAGLWRGALAKRSARAILPRGLPSG